jgi:hypothetical protein
MPGFDPVVRTPVGTTSHDPLAMRITRTAIGAVILALIVIALALN